MRRSLALVTVLACGCASTPRRSDVQESDLSYLDSERPFPDAPAGATPRARPVPAVEGEIARDDLVEALAAGPADVLGAFDVRPEVRLGKFRGWSIERQPDADSRYASVDLRPGDVVLSVNARSIERPQDFYAVWQELRIAPELVIEVERAGQRRELHFHIRDGAPPAAAEPAKTDPRPAQPVRASAPAPARNAVKSSP